jgi:hypothetical protein
MLQLCWIKWEDSTRLVSYGMIRGSLLVAKHESEALPVYNLKELVYKDWESMV